MSTLEFNKLICGSIFRRGFNPFEENNTVTFSDRGIAVVYAPNGTGKTTLMKTLNGEEGSSFSLKYENAEYANNSSGLFYVISDQTDRNIIRGTTRDFFLGADIQREFALKDAIKLNDEDFLNKEKNELPLSTGEQNFLSLTFEMLRAKNSPCNIVIVDDPISSFDSIYKNKIVFALIHILNEKKRLVLTHNIDVLRLMEAQFPKSFNLYLFNNSNDGLNGFIMLSPKERDMVINIEKLLIGLRDNILDYVVDQELFLMSMIPFCRGYAMIQNDSDSKEALTSVMHGYKTESVDIASIYRSLFKISDEDNRLPPQLEISVESILEQNVDTVDIVARDEYPLLNKTLKHTFTYLFLRLYVEKTLVEKYDLVLNGKETLGVIIDKALPRNTSATIKSLRVRLNSKKVLVNEFNHFEGNMSIFQPAIDISDEVLSKEKASILAIMEEIKSLS